jgi:DNA phosphorothioation-dependent restriction protein DptH
LSLEHPDIGYVFCPEHRSGTPELLYAKGAEDARLWLFGPSLLPDEQADSGDIHRLKRLADESVDATPLGSLASNSAAYATDEGNDKSPSGSDTEPLDLPAARDQLTERLLSADPAVDILLGRTVAGGGRYRLARINPREPSSNDGWPSWNGEDNKFD